MKLYVAIFVCNACIHIQYSLGAFFTTPSTYACVHTMIKMLVPFILNCVVVLC